MVGFGRGGYRTSGKGKFKHTHTSRKALADSAVADRDENPPPQYYLLLQTDPSANLACSGTLRCVWRRTVTAFNLPRVCWSQIEIVEGKLAPLNHPGLVDTRGEDEDRPLSTREESHRAFNVALYFDRVFPSISRKRRIPNHAFTMDRSK